MPNENPRSNGDDGFDRIFNVRPDASLALSIGKVLWPEFVQKGQFVFLAEQFDADPFSDQLRIHGEKIEEGVNTIYLDGLFGDPDNEPPEDRETWENLARLLCETWVAKAQRDFPSMSFEARFAWYQPDLPMDLGVFIRQKPHTALNS